MNETNIKEIIQNILRNDENPPSADWGIYDYGVELTRSLDTILLTELATEALRELPASSAISLLNGVLDHATIPSLQEVLLNVLPMARETTSGAVISVILRERCRIPYTELAKQLIEGIKHATTPKAQNNYAYAIFTVLGHGRPRWGTGLTAIEVETIQCALAEIAKSDLTKYARETLEECIVKA